MVSLTWTKVVIGGTIAFYYHSPNAQAPAGPLRSTWAGPQPVETCEAVERLLFCRLVDGRCATPEEVERFPEDDGRLRRSLVQHGHPRLLFHYCCFTSVLILSRNSVNVCWIIVTHHVVSLSYMPETRSSWSRRGAAWNNPEMLWNLNSRIKHAACLALLTPVIPFSNLGMKSHAITSEVVQSILEVPRLAEPAPGEYTWSAMWFAAFKTGGEGMYSRCQAYILLVDLYNTKSGSPWSH